MTDCTWSGSACTGTYAPPCAAPNCYFIHPATSTAATPAGTPTDPFKDLTQAITIIGTKNARIYVAGDPS